jgi:hypothetical protein
MLRELDTVRRFHASDTTDLKKVLVARVSTEGTSEAVGP